MTLTTNGEPPVYTFRISYDYETKKLDSINNSLNLFDTMAFVGTNFFSFVRECKDADGEITGSGDGSCSAQYAI